MYLPVYPQNSFRSLWDMQHTELLGSKRLVAMKRGKGIHTNMHIQMHQYFNSKEAKYLSTHIKEAGQTLIRVSSQFCLLHAQPTWWNLVSSSCKCVLLGSSVSSVHEVNTSWTLFFDFTLSSSLLLLSQPVPSLPTKSLLFSLHREIHLSPPCYLASLDLWIVAWLSHN